MLHQTNLISIWQGFFRNQAFHQQLKHLFHHMHKIPGAAGLILIIIYQLSP